MSKIRFCVGLSCVVLAAVLLGATSQAQTPAAPSAQPQRRDTLGRDTPRGAVLGFMNAARTGREELAAQYLNTTLRGDAAVELAHQLFVVLDTRLPPRLNELSDRPEGSLPNPLKPDIDIAGTINTDAGPLQIIVELSNRGALGQVWVFSRETLNEIPAVYDEVNAESIDRYLPGFLAKHYVAGIRLFEWLVLLLLFPIVYRVTGWLGHLLRPVLAAWRRRRGITDEPPTDIVPGALRLLLLAAAIRWMVGIVELPLLERQFWSAIARMSAIIAIAWGLLLINKGIEAYARRRLNASVHTEISALLRLARRTADTVIILAGGLWTLHYFGFEPTAALAGLGIGGIAVALAAQKTLENVIGGLSIIFDKAVSVGDFLKVGDTMGTVDDVGLRSTRIRTQDRTILSVPNGQIANANIETFSARDKFWFHHFIGLSYETTSTQMRSVIGGIRSHLAAQPALDRRESLRVRFFRFGPFSLDVEVYAYLFARDWEAFLEMQQELLLEIMGIVERAGAVIALPSQTLHVSNTVGETGGQRAVAGLHPRVDVTRQT